MKKAVKNIFLAAILAVAGANVNGQPSLNDKTYGEVRLDLERTSEQKDYDELKSIIKYADANLPILRTNSYAEAIDALREMQTVLLKRHFSYGVQKDLSSGLRTKKIDCDLYSLLLMSMAERKKYPVNMVFALDDKYSGHTYIRWYLDNGEVINWEATSGFAYSQKKDMLPEEIEREIRKQNAADSNIRVIKCGTKQEYLDLMIDDAPDLNLRILPQINRTYAREMLDYYKSKREKGSSESKWNERATKLETILRGNK